MAAGAGAHVECEVAQERVSSNLPTLEAHWAVSCKPTRMLHPSLAEQALDRCSDGALVKVGKVKAKSRATRAGPGTKVNVGAKSRKRALVNAGMTNSRKRVTGISRKRSRTH